MGNKKGLFKEWIKSWNYGINMERRRRKAALHSGRIHHMNGTTPEGNCFSLRQDINLQ